MDCVQIIFLYFLLELHIIFFSSFAKLAVYLISKAKSSVKKLDISQLKGDIHKYILSTSSFLCDFGELRYQQNNGGYQIT